MLTAINSLHFPLPFVNSLALATNSRLNSSKPISGGGRWSVMYLMKNEVPHAVGLKEAFVSESPACRRRLSSSWIVFESHRETSSARVSTAATGAGRGYHCAYPWSACSESERRAGIKKVLAHIRLCEEVRVELDYVERSLFDWCRVLWEGREAIHCDMERWERSEMIQLLMKRDSDVVAVQSCLSR